MLSYIMKVKKMTIGNDEQKSRLYLKKILLNRPTLVHIEDRLQPKVSFRKRVSTRLAGAD